MHQLITIDKTQFPHPVYLTKGKQPLIGYLTPRLVAIGVEELVFEPSSNFLHCTAELLHQIANEIELANTQNKAPKTGRIPVRKK